MKWLLAEIVERAPVARRELWHRALTLKFVKPDAIGRTTLLGALRSLRRQGCVVFDHETVWWTGKAPPVGFVGNTKYKRFRKLAAGDEARYEELRLAEIERLQGIRNAALFALRPATAPPLDLDEMPAWRPSKPLVLTPTLRDLITRAMSSPHAIDLIREMAGLEPMPRQETTDA